MTWPGRRLRAWAAGLTAMVGLLLAAAPSASAGPLVDAVGSCEGQAPQRTFAQWADLADYVIAPDGALTGGAAGWQLSGAQVVQDNEPWYVSGASAPAALSLTAGQTATSPAMCVTLVHPTLRFFAVNEGDPLSTLRVDVLYEDVLGRVQSLATGVVSAGDEWAPTLPLPVLANLLVLLPGGQTPVAFRFVPQGAGGDWRVDDVWVDPYFKR